ncbi:phosphomevalonate kinase [Caldibacillus lycopersici]|uniref:phosphomevalonate kinase n=1 Tax=Perspicuibacillus lycopersici TaxID=1325689 RepID=A0AAE3IX76_9BACI|nr:phosphomevalonate kinase [Perspicuibacillus lycopersici]MCU9615049.1 phosphomevalonate kinase [Perspicuibacillus lycopersici]
MQNKEMVIKVPGKLFIAGEYAILEKGQQAIVIAVDRYITGKIKASTENILSLPQLNFPTVTWKENEKGLKLNVDSPKLVFIKNAISLVNQYLKEQSIPLQPFSFTVTSELDDRSGRKYGLGSSAAIVVSVITSMLHFYAGEKIQPTKELIYKLSAIAHYRTQGNGSCADIAASTYGGWLQYVSFRPEWLSHQMKQSKQLTEIVRADWPQLFIRRVTPPEGLQLCIGWTGESAKTAPMVEKIQLLKNDYIPLYKDFLNKSQSAVTALIECFQTNDLEGAIKSLTENREALKVLGMYTGVSIETPELVALIEIANKYGSGKSSGAGGGDCGIAFLRANTDLDKLYKEWEQSGIVPLPLHVSSVGATTVAS